MPEQLPTYLVTGATSGIGAAIATQLARTGAHVIVGARTNESGESAAARIRNEAPEAHVDVIAGDLSHLAEVRRLAEQVTGRTAWMRWS